MAGADVDGDNEEAREGLKTAGEHLTKEQLDQVRERAGGWPGGWNRSESGAQARVA